MTRYRISELAGRTGTRPSTLRFYEQAGLLRADRSEAGYRLYGDDAVERLGFIASGKYLGLPLEEIRELLGVWQDSMCADVRRRLRPMLEARIADAEQRASGLSAFIARLGRALAEVDGPPLQGRCEPGCGCLHHPHDAAAAPATPSPRRQEPGHAPVPIACTLADADRADRIKQWRRLLAHARRREPIDGGFRIHLPSTVAGQAAELAAAEQQCCAFFAFTLRLTGAELLFEVRAPDEAAPLLARLFASRDHGMSLAAASTR
ncbi:MAG: MerR family transcriptional regulator [Micromonosporaceae bacterium]